MAEERSGKPEWYVAHTYAGYENKVKLDIEQSIKNRNMEELIFEVRIPTQMVTELKNGKERKHEKKLYPGYVLVHMIMTDDTWYVVRNTRGVTGFVGPDSKPVPISKAEICQLLPDVSPTTVEAVLGQMTKDGRITKLGQARATKYVNAKYIK